MTARPPTRDRRRAAARRWARRKAEAASPQETFASVDPSTGDLRMSYAFELPQARGRVQPELSLNYSSSSGDGDAGFGWSLSVPSIERRGTGGAPDPELKDPDPNAYKPNMSGMDHLFFNGIPLVPICRNGWRQPMLVRERRARWDDGHYGSERILLFRAQVEHGPGAAYLWSPDRLRWLVIQPDGTWMELGSANRDSAGTEKITLRDGRSGVLRWHLTREYDAHRTAAGKPTNPIEYVWANRGADGQELTDIYDTPTDPDGTDAGFDGYAHHVHLTYDGQPFAHFSVARWRATPLRRLVAVDVTSQDINGGARAMVRRYHLAYDTDPVRVLGHLHHSHLVSITMEGRCGNSSASVQSAGNVLETNGVLPATNCLTAPATSFEYTNAFVIPSAPAALNGLGSLNNSPPPPKSYCTKGTLGLSCDGCPDGMTPTNICPAATGGLVCECRLINDNGPVNELKAASVADFNNDGWPDLIIPAVNGRKQESVCLHQGNGSFTCDNDLYTLGAASLPEGDKLHPARRTGTYWGDFIGDGQLNKLVVGEDTSGSAVGEDALQGFAAFSPVGPLFGSSTSYSWTPGLQGFWDFVPKDAVDGIFRIDEKPSFALDVNADGLTDLFVLRSAAQRQGSSTLPTMYVAYGFGITTRNAAGIIKPFNHPIADPTATNREKIPLDYSDLRTRFTVADGLPIWIQLGKDASARVSARSQAGKPPPKSAPEFADMNGDGLPDLVAVVAPPGQTEVAVRYWPGYGDGTFGTNVTCATGGYCVTSPGTDGAITLSDSELPAGFDPDDTYTTFHDLNGDGLADLVIATPQAIDVRFNLDGTAFQSGSSWVHLTASDLGDMWSTETAKLRFADVDGSGIDDLVFADKTMGYVDPIEHQTKQGLLTTISNGVGVTTTIEYDTIARLDKAAVPPWTKHSAQSTHVVTSITTDNGLAGAQLLRKATTFSYANPVYEPHSRSFRGFETVRSNQAPDAISPGRTTVRTFLIGQCPHDQAKPCGLSADNPWDALRGLAVLTETREADHGAFAGQWLSTEHARYQVRQVAKAADGDGRVVRLVYPEQSDTFIADPTAKDVPTNSVQLADVAAPLDPVLVGAPRSLSLPSLAHLSSGAVLDDWGRTTSHIDYGAEGDDAIVTQTTFYTPPGAPYGLLSAPRTTNKGKPIAPATSSMPGVR